jgi:hypothetical protein
VSEDKRRHGDALPLLGSGRHRPHQHAVQDGGEFIRVRPDGTEQRVERADTRRRQPGDDLGDQPQRGPGVAHLEQERHEEHRRRRGSGLQYRHFQDQAADLPWGPHGREQAHVGPERDAAEHNLVHAELIQQAQHLIGVQVHPVGARVPGFVAPAVTEQVEQHDAVAPGRQCPGQAAAQVGVEQDAMQPDQGPVPRAVNLIVQPVLAVGERVPRTVRARYFRAHDRARRLFAGNHSPLVATYVRQTPSDCEHSARRNLAKAANHP